jgi:ubiquinol-cytochrome c reductase iron-sulfur subunit
LSSIEPPSGGQPRPGTPSPDTTPVGPAWQPPTGPDPQRRLWLIATGTAGGIGAAAVALPFATTLAPSERARAAGADVAVDIGDIPPGGMKTVEWRGQPVWILRRTPEMLAALPGLDAELADPRSARDGLPDALRTPERAIKPEYLVAVGICTHLGCSPTLVAPGVSNPSVGNNWQGGFFCPCHGSTFDASGRVFRNKPAPTNLPVPPHRYASDTRLIIGSSDAA